MLMRVPRWRGLGGRVRLGGVRDAQGLIDFQELFTGEAQEDRLHGVDAEADISRCRVEQLA
jgi:hypothetical protein